MEKNFYVTSPIFYPNAQPHLGHAYTALLCDTLTRAHKLAGDATYFLTGTDENSEKIIQAAEKAGKEPRAYLDEVVQRFKDLYSMLGIEYDQFIRTSDEQVHWPGAIEMWKRLEKAGALYKSTYAGLYCVGHEAFITEKELDENGLCPDHGIAPEKIEEENWFFKLTDYAARIEQAIVEGSLPIVPERRKNEMLAFLRAGVEDVSFSRPAAKMTWGIPVPGDETQKMYVWVDALTNYVSALGFGRGEELMRFWPGTHVMGKDILRFHAIFWPAMLMAAELPLPKRIFVHGTIISDGKKMSKTLGNVISPYELVEKYGADATRYLLLRHVHSFEDSDITWERLDEWYTANLTNGLGNLVARVMKLAETHLDAPVEIPGEGLPQEFWDAFDRFDFMGGMNAVWEKIQEADERITREEPFKLVKSDPEAGKKLIAELVTELYWIARMLNPYMPAANAAIKQAVKENKKPENLFPRLAA